MATQHRYETQHQHTSARYLPNAAANDEREGPPEQGQALTQTFTRLPVVQQIYRAFTDWADQFKPRHYERTPVYVKQPDPPRRRRGYQP